MLQKAGGGVEERSISETTENNCRNDSKTKITKTLAIND